ncbi:MAG TPA: hypothetical protein VF278_22325, partial [Pirellulales bacterium]
MRSGDRDQGGWPSQAVQSVLDGPGGPSSSDARRQEIGVTTAMPQGQFFNGQGYATPRVNVVFLAACGVML